MSSNAPFAGCELTRGSQGGYAGGFVGNPPTTWPGTRSKRTCLSTYEAEGTHAAGGARGLEYKHNWLNGVGIALPGPHDFFVDNAALALDAGAPIRKWPPRPKQFAIEDRYMQQVVGDRIATVVQVPGTEPAADAMAKPLPKGLLGRHFEALQGPPRG